MEKTKTGGKKREKKKIKTFLVATNVVTSDRPNADRLERRPLVPKAEIEP